MPSWSGRSLARCSPTWSIGSCFAARARDPPVFTEARGPFPDLTRWLGAGKTTALNRMLAATHGKRIAVLVNELGRISIDTQLIIDRGGDVLELAGGCVCCKVDIKNDLWD